MAAALFSARWIHGPRFAELLEAPPDGRADPATAGAPAKGPEATGEPSPIPEGLDDRAARGLLRLLGRLPLSPWRNTCLYRSVARCLLLRWRGVPARVRLGVRRDDDGAGPLGAHAWVEASGRTIRPDCREHAVLEPGHRLRATIPGPGGLSLEVDGALKDAVQRWLPLHAEWHAPAPDGATGEAPRIRVRAAPEPAASDRPTPERGPFMSADGASGSVPPEPHERRSPDFSLGGVEGRVDPAGSTVHLRGARGRGRVGLVEAGTTLSVPAGAGADLYSMLTIAAALLLGRRGRALVHAGAVVAPKGGAWLVAGDARSGKSTTCAALIAAGWDWVSDDQVVLLPPDDGPDPAPRVVGWPRPFHLDTGWPDGRPTGERTAVDPTSLEGGGRQTEAPLAGVLLPEVEPDAPTRARPAPPADAFAALVRQSPWLLVDEASSEGLLQLLRVASTPPEGCLRLRLGTDSFGRPDVLAGVLAEAGIAP